MARGGAALRARCLVDLLHRGALAVVDGAVVSRGRRAVSAVSAGLGPLGCAGRLVSLLQDGEGHLLELLAPRVDLALVRGREGEG